MAQNFQWVKITHPNFPDAPAARVRLDSFEGVWEPKGWTLADEQPTTSETANEVPDVDDDYIQEDD